MSQEASPTTQRLKSLHRSSWKEAERKLQEEKIRMKNILSENPLLAGGKAEFKVKSRWDDDVILKNCAKGERDPQVKHFINDTLWSEFHKKFMEKYAK